MRHTQNESRIDKIIALICEEAESRKGVDGVARIYNVYREVSLKLMHIIDVIRENERIGNCPNKPI